MKSSAATWADGRPANRHASTEAARRPRDGGPDVGRGAAADSARRQRAEPAHRTTRRQPVASRRRRREARTSVVGQHCGVANHLDFLLALETELRHSTLGFIPSNRELSALAISAGLATPQLNPAARWTGELVSLGFLTHGPLGAGDRRPLPPPTLWTESDVSRLHDFRITGEGHAAAERVRRRDRETWTDVALGIDRAGPVVALSEPHQRALAAQVRVLRDALDSERHTDAIGAAKDVVEASCKVVIEEAGGAFDRGAGILTLVKAAIRHLDRQDGSNLARSLATTVQRIAELRNDAGAGHGHASVGPATSQTARLAGSAACAIATFLLTAQEDPRDPST
jgi:hypothetical protein